MSEAEAFLAAITPAQKAKEAQRLDTIFRHASGFEPALWGNIIGYGAYDYTYASGRSGRHLATGFAPRAHGFSVYIMPGYRDFPEIMARLGKVKQGKACTTFRKLPDIDEDVLAELISAGLARLKTIWPVSAA